MHDVKAITALPNAKAPLKGIRNFFERYVMLSNLANNLQEGQQIHPSGKIFEYFVA